MKNHDLLDAIGEVSEETVQKYALPDATNTKHAKDDENMDSTNSGPIKQTVKKPFRLHPGIAAAAVALCVGLNAAIFFGIRKMRQDTPGMTPGAQISSEEIQMQCYKTPDLIGMDFDEAVLIYGDTLQIVMESQEYSDYEAGRIFAQDMEPGEPFSKGDSLNVRVSCGQKKVLLPDITDWDFEAARATIVGLGLFVDKHMSYDPSVEKDKVISVDPQGPIEIEPGSYVRVTVSLGPNADVVPVPNFVNMSWDLAKEIAESLNLAPSMKKITSAATAGTVLSQSIPPETEVSEGTEIELTVSGGGKKGAVRIAFGLPADVKGEYSIRLYENDAEKADGGLFAPELSAGITTVVVEGENTAELRAVLVNDANGKEVVIGTYHVDFEARTYENISGDIAQAFKDVQ